MLAQTRLEFDYTKIPVHPSNKTSIDVRLLNLGNGDLGYDLFLESPPGWFAGFDDLSSQGGANSASTGLMLEDGQMNIGISYIPPQVMTLAGAELTVILRVVSQSEEAKLMYYELPLVVQEISEVTVDLESSFSSIAPGNTISLQYSIENRGNTNLNLTPSLQLPQGWTQNTVLEDFNLGWTDSKNFLISVTAEGVAKSGQIKFSLDSSGYAWSHIEEINVVVLPEPVLTFASLEIAGETWSNIFGSGKHPTGVPINYTWLVENNEDSQWTPSVSLQLDNNLLGDCTSVGTVSKGDAKPLTCTIIIPASADPSSEPEFKVTLSGDLVSINQTVSMLVAVNKEVSWELDGVTALQTGETSDLEVTVTNTGNSPVSGAVSVDSSNGLKVEIDDSDRMIDLEAGQSQIIRLKITAKDSGKGTLSISISGSDDVINSQLEVEVASEGEVSVDDSSALESIFWVIWIIVPIFAIVAVAVLTRKKKNQEAKQWSSQLQQVNYQQAQKQIIYCFSCRLPIQSAMQGCPSCGARYHAACRVENCLNCGVSSSTFVNVE